MKKELLEKYPTKVARKRAKQIIINEVGPDLPVPEIQSNVRTVPGIITQRGCSYAGCKGVILGPTRDIVNITHGPIGCGFYSWLTRKESDQTATARMTIKLYELLFFNRYAGSGDCFRRRRNLRLAIRRPMIFSNPTL